MPSYLQKRRRLYYAVLEIPKALRSRLDGKARFIRSLETDSLTVARRRVGPIVSGWLADLERARGGGDQTPAEQDAAFFRKALREAGDPERRDEIMEHLTDRADDIALRNMDWGQKAPLSAVPEAAAFFREAVAAGTADHLDEWLSSLRVVAPVRDMRRHPHVVARLSLQPYHGPAVRIPEHKDGVPGDHVDGRFRITVVMVA